MVLGAALVLAALSLFLWNQWEDRAAGDASDQVLEKLLDQVGETGVPLPEPDLSPMTEVEIDGYAYIGYLSIPVLELKLPVMSEWDDTRLKIAPCRYSGSTKTDDMVIAGHNYIRHFGPLKNLSVGDAVYFQDMDGVVSVYEVAEIDTLAPTAVEDMTDSGYALTLFTCTYGGQSRMTVRCSRINDAENTD